MKKLLLLSLATLFLNFNTFALKYICSQNNMADSTFTTVFRTAEECSENCTGIGSVCEPTGDDTVVNTLDAAM